MLSKRSNLHFHILIFRIIIEYCTLTSRSRMTQNNRQADNTYWMYILIDPVDSLLHHILPRFVCSNNVEFYLLGRYNNWVESLLKLIWACVPFFLVLLDICYELSLLGAVTISDVGIKLLVVWVLLIHIK